MSHKNNIKNIRDSFESKGYKLLTTKYINAFQELEFICPNGHIYHMRWNNFQQGSRCYLCSGKKKKNINFIRSEFEKEGYTLLDTTYKDANKKLNYICPEGHKHSISWSHWSGGQRCRKCGYEKLSLDYLNDGNPSWKGGKSFEPYCQEWTCNLKEGISFRDNEKCQNPFCCNKNPNDLCVHHIDYNKKNCEPSNLITVCRSCNSIANFQRDWWESLYKEVMRRKELR